MRFTPARVCANAFGLMRKRAFAALMIAGAGLAIASPASATNYYGVSVFGSIDGTPFQQGNSGQTVPQYKELAGANGWLSVASANDNDGGTVTADVGVPPNWMYGTNSSLQHISASSQLSYDFSLIGVDPSVIIPVLVSGALHATQSDPNLGGYASATFQLGGPSVELLNYSIDTIGSLGTINGGSITVDDVVYMQAGLTYRLAMSAYAKGRSDESLDEVSLPNGQYSLFSAGADPIFTILGDYAASYHFVGLPDSAIGSVGGGGTPAVPEPASWAMMIVGLGMIGSQMRRRQRVGMALT